MKKKFFYLLFLLISCIVILLIYRQTFNFDFVNWDDNIYVINNPTVDLKSDRSIIDHILTPDLGYPVPVTIWGFTIQNLIHGLKPEYFHAGNVMIFLILAIAIFALFLRIGIHPFFAIIGTLFFITHPACVEPVCWITARKELLSALFTLIFLHLFLKPHFKFEGRLKIFSGFIVFLLSLLSKPVMVLLPFMIFSSEMMDLKNVEDGKKEEYLKKSLIYLGIFLIPSIIVITIGIINQSRFQAIESPSGFFNWIVPILRGFFYHSRIIFYPFELKPKYIPDASSDKVVIESIAGCLIFLVFLALIIISLRKSSEYFFPLLLILISYLPSSGIIPLKRQVSDSYVFIPLIGFSWIFAKSLNKLWIFFNKFKRLKYLRGIITGIFLSLLFLNSAISKEQSLIWKDGFSLWSYTYNFYPDSPQVCRNLGNAFIFGKRREPLRAVLIYKSCSQKIRKEDFFRKNLAIALYMSGNFIEAKKEFLKILEKDKNNEIAKKYLYLIEKNLK